MTKENYVSSPNPAWLDVVADKVKDLRFGTVQIVVQDSRVVQIERTEKTRLEQQSSSSFKSDRTSGGQSNKE